MTPSVVAVTVALFSGGYLLLMRNQLENSLVTRMVSAAVILGFVYLLFQGLTPNAPVSIVILYVLPLGLLFAIATIWPERKGKLWPYGERPYTQGVLFQVWWSIVATLGGFTDGAYVLYVFYFQNGAQNWHPLIQISEDSYLTGLWILTVICGGGFLLQFWRFVRMLPPKSLDSSCNSSQVLVKMARNLRTGPDDYLTPTEVEDVLISRLERSRGQGKHFSNAQDLFAWLDSE